MAQKSLSTKQKKDTEYEAAILTTAVHEVGLAAKQTAIADSSCINNQPQPLELMGWHSDQLRN